MLWTELIGHNSLDVLRLLAYILEFIMIVVGFNLREKDVLEYVFFWMYVSYGMQVPSYYMVLLLGKLWWCTF